MQFGNKRRSNLNKEFHSYKTCVPNPSCDEDYFINIHKWMLLLCDGNKAAAFLLANFIVWQNWKIRTDAYNKQLNDIAEQHGEPRRLSEDVWLFKSYEGLSDVLINLFSVKTIKTGLKFLESKKVISIHACPNKNHCYDKRSYFRFYPEVVKDWLKNIYPTLKKENMEEETVGKEKMIDSSTNSLEKNKFCENNNQETIQVPDYTETVKVPHALGKNVEGSGKSAVTISYKHITNKQNQSINEIPNFSKEKKSKLENIIPEIEPIVLSLVEQGINPNQFYEDNLRRIELLQKEGVTVSHFKAAYQKALELKGNVAVNYVITMVANELINLKRLASQSKVPKTDIQPDEYINDFTNGLDWMGDLVELKELEDKVLQ